MLNNAPVTAIPASAVLARELTGTQVRIPPAQARVLNLQPGQLVQGQVIVNGDVRTLQIKQQQLPLPSTATLPAKVIPPNQPITLQVKVVDGNQVLTVVQPAAQSTVKETANARPNPQLIQLSQLQARNLGLVVGQSIQATVQQRGNATTLRVGENSIALPQRLVAPGKTMQFTVSLQRGQYILTPQGSTLPPSSLSTPASGAGLPRDNLMQLEGKQLARLTQNQMTQLGLRVGQTVTAVVRHSAAGSELKLPNGTLPLPAILKNAQAPVALQLVSLPGDAGGKSAPKYFLLAAGTQFAGGVSQGVPLAAQQVNAQSQSRIAVSAGQAKDLSSQLRPENQGQLQGNVISKGSTTLLEVGNRQFSLPRGFVVSQAPVALVVDRQGNNFLLKQAQPAGLAANNLSGGARMLTAEPMNLSMRPNIVYVEGAAAGMRINPEQARVLGLREGQVINAVVAQRADGNLLLVGNQQLAMPARMALPQGVASFLVSVVNGNMLLSLVDPSNANKLNQRADADARFGRLLGHAGGMHLGRLFSPSVMPQVLGASTNGELGQILRGLLMNSREISSSSIRRSLDNFGLFTESEIRQTGMAPANQGIKSVLIGLRALFQSRQLDTTSLSGAIDELEARQIESLAQQVAGKTSLSWVIPFADQWPVYIRLSQDETPENADNSVQKTWSVDIEAGLDAQTSMSANIRVDASKQIEVRIWLPSVELFTVAQASKEELAKRLGEHGVTLATLNIFPTSRIPITDDVPEQRVGLNIDA
ncbi:MAG: hypothetical protein QMB25_01125 [Pseudomonadales bacterium]